MAYNIESTQNEDAGEYTLVTRISYSKYPNILRICETKLEVLPLIIPKTFTNSNPYFVDFISSHSTVCGAPWIYQLPEVKDDDEYAAVEMTLNLGAAASFL